MIVNHSPSGTSYKSNFSDNGSQLTISLKSESRKVIENLKLYGDTNAIKKVLRNVSYDLKNFAKRGGVLKKCNFLMTHSQLL